MEVPLSANVAIVARCAAFQTTPIVLPLGEYVSEGGGLVSSRSIEAIPS